MKGINRRGGVIGSESWVSNIGNIERYGIKI